MRVKLSFCSGSGRRLRIRVRVGESTLRRKELDVLDHLSSKPDSLT